MFSKTLESVMRAAMTIRMNVLHGRTHSGSVIYLVSKNSFIQGSSCLTLVKIFKDKQPLKD